ncbi:hypothetical protein HanHA300_Chr02g0044541 [Helianthus annuus]|nr:hypothetical protein HanHA300_Chr02g0044541 [Helianthus annuus]KAJ0617998.1 hypothetical protein HanHA89_Chr02g0048151 [Helianthus annuus]
MALRVCFVAVVIICLLMTSHFSPVHCRHLQPTAITTTTTECKQTGEMPDFTVCATRYTSYVNNSDNRRLKMPSLEYILASGPSKKGPGH